MKAENRIMKRFRFPPKMVKALVKEADNTGRTQTRVLELAFGNFMSLKAEHRSKLNSVL